MKKNELNNYPKTETHDAIKIVSNGSLILLWYLLPKSADGMTYLLHVNNKNDYVIDTKSK